MRLIDADALLQAIKKADESDPDLATCWSRGSIRRVIEGLPTIEAAPVVHGRWEAVHDGFGRCSNCHRMDEIHELTTHCRFCGARMDGDGDD